VTFAGTRTREEVEGSGVGGAEFSLGGLEEACVIACLMKRPAAALSISARSDGRIMSISLRRKENRGELTCGWVLCGGYLVKILFNAILIYVRMEIMGRASTNILTNSGTTGCVFGSIPRDLR
jgi:hypothetical protein